MKKLTELLGVSMRTIIYGLFTVIFLVCLSLSVASIEFFVEYSSLPVGLTKAFMGIILLKLVDDTIYGRIDTIIEIKNKNTAYAITILASAVIIAAALIAS